MSKGCSWANRLEPSAGIFRPMNFSLRLALSLAALVTCTAVMGVAALAAMNQQHRRVQTTNDRYDDLRGLYEIGSRAVTARLLLNAGAVDTTEVRQQLLAAVQAADRLLARLPASPEQQRSHQRATLENMRSNLESALVAGRPSDADRPISPSAAPLAALNACLSQVAALSAQASSDIAEERVAINQQVVRAQWMLGATLAGTLVLALALGVMQHRSIARPVRALRRGVAHMADRLPAQPIGECGPGEFRLLIRQFNDMSRVIRALEESLKNQVETKSRQLIRSERLAGLGYLAAGLAHEINNPLGVIGGYAQTMLRRLDTNPDSAASERERHDLSDALRTISDEVFRCQDITSGLLKMSRHGEERVEGAVDMQPLVVRVTQMLQHLPLASERQIIVQSAVNGPTVIRGHHGQLTQVLVNLVTNALEATDPGSGVVRVSIASQAASILIRVEDNGCGMNAETLAHAFDPLFTDKPSRGLSGFGLGLSVSHAIIERHGGRIDASSAGPGRGSAFVIELPALAADLPTIHSGASQGELA